MGLLDFLKPSTTKTSTLTDQQKAVNQPLSDLLSQGLESGATPYSGEMVASIPDSWKTKLQKLLAGYKPNTFGTETSSAISSTLSGQPSMVLDPATTANYFQNSVANPMMTQYQQNIAPKIREGFAAVGGAGGATSSRAGTMQARALSGLQESLAGQLSQMQYQNQGLQAQLAESAANRQMQGVGLAQQYNMQPLYGAQQYGLAMQPLMQNEQAKLSAQYQEFLRTSPENNPYMQGALGYLNTNQMAVGSQPSTFSSIASGVGNVVGAASGLGWLGGGGSAIGSALGYGNTATNQATGTNPYSTSQYQFPGLTQQWGVGANGLPILR